MVGLLGISAAHSVSATASFTLTPQDDTIAVPRGGSVTIPTTALLHTTSSTGYALTIAEVQAVSGVTVSAETTNATGSLVTNTPIATTPTTLKTSTVATAATGDVVSTAVTITASATAMPGTSSLKLTYVLTENPVPINPAVCENANPASACRVDMDASLIPVTYTGNTANPQWSKANVNEEGNWYNYQAKQWANAVAVTAATRSVFQNAVAVTVIPESDVMAYYTYIPRYEYQVCRPNASDPISGITAAGCPSSTASPYNFNIKFQTADQTTAYNGTTVGGWATHPAFTFGTTQLNGFWVGKYQTSSANVSDAEAGGMTALTDADVFIKPNQFGLANQSISQEFTTAQDLTNSSSPIYEGFNATATDSYMMTNSDWGAVAYLATSIYGQGAANPIATNNCVDGYDDTGRTGWSGGSPTAGFTSDCAVGTNDNGAYQTAVGQTASTTGNTSGIYDMAGGNWQNLMAYYVNATNVPGYIDQSGFSTLPLGKYYNAYNSAIFSIYAQTAFGDCTWATCGGQALFEAASISPVTAGSQLWGSECSYMATPGGPWAARGGGPNGCGSESGLWSMGNTDGNTANNGGFRVVLSQP